MKCPFCDVGIEDDWKLNARDGKIVWLTQGNQFAHSHNTPIVTKEDGVCGLNGCDREIPAGWTLYSRDGYVTWHNALSQIAHRHNFSQKFRGGSTKKKKAAVRKEADRPVGDLGKAFLEVLDNPDDEEAAREARAQLLVQLSKVIERGDSSSVRAAEMAAQIVGEMFKAMKPPGPGEACKLCGRLDKPPVILISQEMAKSKWQD